MTVEQMIDKLKKLSPWMTVVVPGSDHSYRKIDSLMIEHASIADRGQLTEWDSGRSIEVAVIR